MWHGEESRVSPLFVSYSFLVRKLRATVDDERLHERDAILSSQAQLSHMGHVKQRGTVRSACMMVALQETIGILYRHFISSEARHLER